MAAVDQADHRGAGYEPACGHRRGLHGGDHRAGRARRPARAGERGGELVQIIGSRSLLVDVHLLGGRD